MSFPPLNIKCIASGDQTDGDVAIFEEIVEPASGPPLHTHRNQVEIFHIIEGDFKFHVDGEEFEKSAGDTAVVKKGSVHAFKNIGKTQGRLKFELLPANRSEEAFEKLVNEGDQIEDVSAFFEEYDMDLAGPPLD